MYNKNELKRRKRRDELTPLLHYLQRLIYSNGDNYESYGLRVV